MKKKITIMVTALALVLCFVVGGTLAWLVDKTDPVQNTFTYGDIDIDLWEHKLNSDGLTLGTEKVHGNTGYKMIPGNTIDKDPTITVGANSEACWLFVKVEKSSNFASYMSYEIATDPAWQALADDSDNNELTTVYYIEVDADTAKTGIDYAVLNNNKVTVLEGVTKDMMENIEDGKVSAPTLTFTAYAIQKEGFTTAVAAWAEASK